MTIKRLNRLRLGLGLGLGLGDGKRIVMIAVILGGEFAVAVLCGVFLFVDVASFLVW